MTDWGVSFLDELDAIAEQASRPATHMVETGRFAVVYQRPDDASYYRIVNAPDGPDPDTASDEEIDKHFDDERERGLGFLVSACKEILVRKGDGEYVPISELPGGEQLTPPLAFTDPEVITLLGRTPKDTSTANTWEFFKRAFPEDPRVAVALHAAEVITWRSESLAEVGEALTKGH